MENGSHIQLRSTAVQAILKKVPNWIVRWGTVLVFLGVLLLFVLSYVIKVPESIPVAASFELSSKSLCITAPQSGVLVAGELSADSLVQEGDLLFVLRCDVQGASRSEKRDFKELAPFEGGVGWWNPNWHVEAGDTILKLWQHQPESLLVSFQLPKKYYNAIFNKELLLASYSDPFSGVSVTKKVLIESLSVDPAGDVFIVRGFIPIESEQARQLSKDSWLDMEVQVVISNPRFLFKLFAILD